MSSVIASDQSLLPAKVSFSVFGVVVNVYCFFFFFFQERRRRGDLMTIDGELSSDEDDGRDPRMRGKMYETNFEGFF